MSSIFALLSSVLAPIAKQALIAAGHELVDYLNMLLN